MVGRRAPSRSAPSRPETSGQISLPKLVSDPLWSLRTWPVLVELGDWELEIPAMCAADWLGVLMAEDLDPDDVFPGQLDEDSRAFVEDQLHTGVLDVLDVQRAALDVISTVAGRPWWVALRLIEVAKQSWDALGGDMAKVDAASRPLGAWLDALFILIVRNIDDQKRTMFLMKLEMAPPGWGPKPEELEMSADAFMDMA